MYNYNMLINIIRNLLHYFSLNYAFTYVHHVYILQYLIVYCILLLMMHHKR